MPTREEYMARWPNASVTEDAKLERMIEAIPAVMAAQHREPLWCLGQPQPPSRESMIREAVVNWVTDTFPVSAHRKGIAAILQEHIGCFDENCRENWCHAGIRAEFRRIEASHAR